MQFGPVVQDASPHRQTTPTMATHPALAWTIDLGGAGRHLAHHRAPMKEPFHFAPVAAGHHGIGPRSLWNSPLGPLSSIVAKWVMMRAPSLTVRVPCPWFMSVAT